MFKKIKLYFLKRKMYKEAEKFNEKYLKDVKDLQKIYRV